MVPRRAGRDQGADARVTRRHRKRGVVQGRRRVGTAAVANYDNIISLAGVLLNKPYEAYDRSEAIYHQIIALEPARWEAYYELAATLQVKDDIPGALAILQQYKERYGERQELAEAETILHNASTRSGDSTESP